MSNILEVTDLTKVYPAYRKSSEPYLAVDKLTFELKKGEILGLLGPNGAGKTTTIQMLLGLTTPTSGKIKYFGKDLSVYRESILSRINFTSTYAQLQGKMTVKQNLTVYGHLYKVDNLEQKIKELTELLGVGHLLDTLFWKLSSGQQTRVILAKGLINSPKLLLMDEPTASLDPDIVNKIIDLIRTLKKEQKVSILYTSHNMEEITRLCDRVMFLEQGKLVAVDTPVGLTKLIGNAKLTITYDSDKQLVTNFLSKEKYDHKFIRKQMVEIGLPDEKIPAVLFDLKKHGVWITDIDIKKPTLEDVFLSFARKGNQ